MSYGLNMNDLPIYVTSAYKNFIYNEKHVTRICKEEVLIIMLDGILFFSEDGIPIKLNKNQYYIQNSGLRQEGIIPSSDAKYYYIHFNGKIESCNNALPIRGFVDSKSMISLFDKLNRLQLLGGSLTEKSAYFYSIISSLKRNAPVSEQEKLIQNITSLIADDMRKSYSLEKISKEFGYSKNQIINIFKTHTGTTPYNYITNMRLSRAKDYLANSNTPINLIAVQTGFDNYINFYKTFKKTENCTPIEFRKRFQKVENLTFM